MITIARIFISLWMLRFQLWDVRFLILLALCGFSDVADGYLSRKLKVESQFGARLDSYADLVMYMVLIYKYSTSLSIPGMFIIWIFVIVILRIIPAGINFFKYKVLATVHTYGNKLSGLLVFCFPIAYYFYSSLLLVWGICIACTFAAVEEILICLCSKELDLNKKSLFPIT